MRPAANSTRPFASGTEEQLPVFEQLGDVRSRAITQGQIADILVTRGELDEALRIRTEDELPVFEQLGDVRSRAVTQGEIADILATRGELDEALRIRTEDELPVFEQLGDVRSRAITQGEIADILVTRGELGEPFASGPRNSSPSSNNSATCTHAPSPRAKSPTSS